MLPYLPAKNQSPNAIGQFEAGGMGRSGARSQTKNQALCDLGECMPLMTRGCRVDQLDTTMGPDQIGASESRTLLSVTTQ